MFSTSFLEEEQSVLPSFLLFHSKLLDNDPNRILYDFLGRFLYVALFDFEFSFHKLDISSLHFDFLVLQARLFRELISCIDKASVLNVERVVNCCNDFFTVYGEMYKLVYLSYICFKDGFLRCVKGIGIC